MKKTFCDRCGNEIRADERRKILEAIEGKAVKWGGDGADYYCSYKELREYIENMGITNLYFNRAFSDADLEKATDYIWNEFMDEDSESAARESAKTFLGLLSLTPIEEIEKEARLSERKKVLGELKSWSKKEITACSKEDECGASRMESFVKTRNWAEAKLKEMK